MLFHVVEHRVLAGLGDAAALMRAHKLTLLITDVGHLDGRH